MYKYWRIGRKNEDINTFIDYLKAEHGYIEKKRGDIQPSQVSYGNGVTMKNTIIANIDGGLLSGNITNTLSKGEMGGKLIRIIWEEDTEREIINFDLKYLRRIKLEKINEKE